MPAKSGGSHALAAFVSIVLASVISAYIEVSAPTVARLTRVVGDWIRELGVPLAGGIGGMMVNVVTLSFLWGIFYHVRRHGGG